MLIRLFLLGVPVPRERLDELVGAELCAGLARSGLLVDEGDAVRGAARIVPHDELLIASDHSSAEEHADHVPGVHRPSVALAHMTVRGSGERALDLCTGNGIQAILLAAHAASVVATDVNARALAYADFNVALNGVGNVETRLGSFFEPVAGEQFDLVVANPPYVISPDSAFLFRDGGLRGDAVSEHVVRRAPESLAPGAFASLMIAWSLDPNNPMERPRSWLEGSGCDAFLLHTATDDPIETAAVWNRELADRPNAYAGAIERWLEYYRELGIEQIAYACLVLRKREDARDGWFETLELPRAGLRPAGRHVRRLFETHDRLTEIDDLLDRRLGVVDDAVVTQEMRFADAHWQSQSLTLRLDAGLPFSAELDASTARIVRGLDGSKTLGEVLAAVFEDDDERDTGEALARQMLAVGFLDFAD